MKHKSAYFWLLVSGLILLVAGLSGLLFFKNWRFSQSDYLVVLDNVATDKVLVSSDQEDPSFNQDRSSSSRRLINQSVSPRLDQAISFLFFGDLMLDRHVGDKLKNLHLNYLLQDLASSTPNILAGHDLVGANLEGAVTNQGAHYNPVQAYDFAFLPARIQELQSYGFNFFSIANNHITDQGARGLEETRKNLTELGLNYSGSADAAVDQNSLRVVDIKGKKIAFISLSMVYHDFNLKEAVELIRAAQVQADLVIINIHWGTEYQHQFSQHQQTIGRALIEAGADIIIGHHPHVVQGMEIYQNKPIFYSLGNFIFDQYFSLDTQQGLAIGLDILDNQTTVFLFPLQSRASIPQLMSGEDKINFLNKYVAWSQLSDEAGKDLRQAKIEITGGVGK